MKYEKQQIALKIYNATTELQKLEMASFDRNLKYIRDTYPDKCAECNTPTIHYLEKSKLRWAIVMFIISLLSFYVFFQPFSIISFILYICFLLCIVINVKSSGLFPYPEYDKDKPSDMVIWYVLNTRIKELKQYIDDLNYEYIRY